MGTRVGIELSPVACRLVELDGPSVQPGQPPATRVFSYAVLPPSGPETYRRLAALAGRPAAVVVWGARSHHRQVVVSKGSYEKMRTEALASARSAGVDTRGAIADVAVASSAIKGAKRQPVVLALASADEISAAVRPLRAAGVRIRSVITPADALLGLARSRQAFAVPGGIEAYVALDETATCVALVRDGSLLGARELPWGYADGVSALAASDALEVARRDDLAARLIDELTEFLTTVGADGGAVAQVSICGGLSELRTMTIPLMERLDVEVEALDSLFGIDVEHLPDPADEFREQASALRLAWGAAADWRGPINLMRPRGLRNRRVALTRAAVVAGVAAGLGTGWAIQESAWWQATTPQPIARRTPAAIPPVMSPPSARGSATSRPATANVPAPSRAPVPPAPTAAPPEIATTPLPSNATVTARPPTLPIAAAGSTATKETTAAATSPAPSVVRVTPPVAAPPVVRVTPPVAAPPVVRVTPPVAAPPVVRVTPPAATPLVARVTPPATAPVAAAPVPPARQPVSVMPSSVTPSVARVTPPPVVRLTPPAAPTVARVAPPPVAAVPVPPTAVAVAPQSAVAAPVVPRPAAPAPSPVTAPARGSAEVRASASRAAQPATRRAEETPVPLDAVLGTILYSPDRKLAIVNGRIVGPGDAVNGARIVDITLGTVLLRDAQGRLRSLTIGTVGGSGSAP